MFLKWKVFVANLFSFKNQDSKSQEVFDLRYILAL